MEMRYDPVSDTTDYVENFRATCPVCGVEQQAIVSAPGVPRAALHPSVLAAADASIADTLALSRVRFLADPPPCGVCSAQT